ncbi:MAG: hypothetical protein HKM95_10605, partial [Inquilinus sp.]|nr:hypothetical protein [Inquilinus sp.]
TCNWHNWKFDLDSGETLVGGDLLRRYPVRIAGDDVLLDATDPPPAERAAAALAGLRRACERHETDRMAREVGRLAQIGADPLDAVRETLRWTHDRFEFGATHAHAAAPDWLARGALAGGLSYAEIEPDLARAALAHYQDFGHSAIYVLKTGELIARLGQGVAEPLLLALVRSLVYARREDLIPEFRAYGPALARWDGSGDRPPNAADFRRLSVTKALDRALASSADIPGLYAALLEATAWQMLNFDLDRQDRTAQPVSQNVSWLDFTHGLTFANAVRELCTHTPALWPAGLLQMACFLGRNAGFVDAGQDVSAWAVDDAPAFLAAAEARLFDHGQPEYIVSAHLVKVAAAARSELAAAPNAPWAPTLLAAVRRFLESPLKRRHALRTARQALDFTALEG